MKDLYDFLVRNKVSPNGLFVLHCAQNSYMYPSYVNYKHEQYRLEITGHLKEEKLELGTIYTPTAKGEALLREADLILQRAKRSPKAKVSYAEWERYITEFNSLFPKGKKEGTSISFRTNPKELMDRFVWFFKEYPDYTWQQVLEATRKYADTFDESTGYTYMQTSKYFIKKDDKTRSTSSTLANIIYNMIEGNDEEITDGYHYFGP